MITCIKCMAPLGAEVVNNAELSQCPSCGVLTKVDLFPAMFKEISAGTIGETLITDNDASCFYHPQKKVEVSCSECGRFLCALCDVELDGKHLCIPCLQAGKKKKTLKNMENHRALYDNITLYSAIGSVFFWFISFLTAPIILFMIFRYWKAPTSILPRTKVRFLASFIITIIQIGGWSFFLLSLFAG